jgi:hypothetical protein
MYSGQQQYRLSTGNRNNNDRRLHQFLLILKASNNNYSHLLPSHEPINNNATPTTTIIMTVQTQTQQHGSPRGSISKFDDEKIDIAQIESAEAAQEGDYSGFTQKTDPKEIRLVRKLDMHIMPSLWAMYFMNYL